MVDTPRKTFPELQALSAPVVDSDLLAVYRSPGPAKRTTASVLKTYMQTGVALLATLAASGGSALIGFIQGGTDATLRTLQDKIRKDIPITPFDFGAVGDASTDDTAALAAMVTYVNSLPNNVLDPTLSGKRPRVEFPFCAGFRTTAPLVFDAWVDLVMYSPLWVVASASATGVWIDMVNNEAVPTYGRAPRNGRLMIDVRRVTLSNWSSENDVGFRFVGYISDIKIVSTAGFCVGWDICNAYGTITLGDHRSNQKCYYRATTTPLPDGQFANHTRINGGSFANDGANAGVARYGIHLVGAGVSGLNTIVLDGQSYELSKSGAGSADCIPLLISGTSALSIRAINQRSEFNEYPFARVTGTVRNVEIGLLDAELSYAYPTSLLLDDQSTGGGSVVLYRHNGATSPLYKPFFDTGPLVEKAVQLTGGVVTIQNMEAAVNVGAAPATQTFTYGDAGPAFDTNGYMANGGPYYGVRVRLNGERTLGITGACKVSNAVTLRVLCFDSAGAQITTAGAVTYEQSAATLNTGIYGGLYTVGVYPSSPATRFDAVLGFSSTVATVFIAVSSQTKSWTLLSQQGAATWFSSTSHLKDQFVGDQIPIALTNVTYVRGMKVVKILPGDSNQRGWVLINGGNWRVEGWQGYESTLPTYTPTNVTPDRSFDADTVTITELADVVGTLIADLQRQAIAL
jgi:hypothetical protein